MACLEKRTSDSEDVQISSSATASRRSSYLTTSEDEDDVLNDGTTGHIVDRVRTGLQNASLSSTADSGTSRDSTTPSSLNKSVYELRSVSQSYVKPDKLSSASGCESTVSGTSSGSSGSSATTSSSGSSSCDPNSLVQKTEYLIPHPFSFSFQIIRRCGRCLPGWGPSQGEEIN
ncbi:uncharacterized protein [Dysidea avara]|uniref:uncharacterized protein n=1 Tax=Dysidea avara TaxID=196820 RepID=UPI00331F250B